MNGLLRTMKEKEKDIETKLIGEEEKYYDEEISPDKCIVDQIFNTLGASVSV